MNNKKIMQNDFDKELQAYFTDVEKLRNSFKQLVAAPKLTKRLLIIWGVGGVGKSSLLRMFRLHCRSVNIPVAIASGDESKSALDVLERWADDLIDNNVLLASFGKTYKHYRAIQAKVDDEANKMKDVLMHARDFASEAVSKTAEATAGAIAGAAIGSLIPGIGTAVGSAIGGMLGKMGADAVRGLLRSKGFTNPDIDLVLDPTKRLTDDFLTDITKIAPTRRIVLILDTFEKMATLEDWACDLAQRLHPNLLLVVAGRGVPNWDRCWVGWLAQADIQEIELMTPTVMRELVQRYYKKLTNNELDTEQADGIIQFARGLPIAISSAVDLMVKYHAKNFHAITSKVINDLAKRLQEGVPDDLKPSLQAAAILRWFDEPTLRAVMQKNDVSGDYEKLQSFPFVILNGDRFALHDIVRETLDANFRVRDVERHIEWHKRAAEYFEKRLKEEIGKETENYELEQLYHWLQADENNGMHLYCALCDNLTNVHMVNRLRVIVGELHNHTFVHQVNRLWSEYYAACLAELEAKGELAETAYAFIAEQEEAEPRLRAYAYSDLGGLLSRWQNLGKTGGIKRALDVLEKSVGMVAMDEHLVNGFFSYAHIYQYMGRWNKSYQYLEACKKYYTEQQNYYGLAKTYSQFMVMYYHMGNLKGILASEKEAREVLSKLPPYTYIKEHVNAFASTCLLAGRYAESEKYAKESLAVMRRLGDIRNSLEPMRWLSWALALQGNFTEASEYCAEHLKLNKQSGEYYIKDEGHGREVWGLVLMLQGQYDQARDQFNQSLMIKEKVKENLWIPTTYIHIATSYEMQGTLIMALEFYQKSLLSNAIGRLQTKSEALAGILRVKYRLGNFVSMTKMVQDARELAEANEFYDHLASLQLIQGHNAWENQNISDILPFYEHAMIYALRYNRFLLDEVLSGRPHGTSLVPIIQYCLERDEEGRQILLALRDWWETGVNEIGTLRPDSISPIQEGIPLMEAEYTARERELGDGTPQKTVIEQFNTALMKWETV